MGMGKTPIFCDRAGCVGIVYYEICKVCYENDMKEHTAELEAENADLQWGFDFGAANLAWCQGELKDCDTALANWIADYRKLKHELKAAHILSNHLIDEAKELKERIKVENERLEEQLQSVHSAECTDCINEGTGVFDALKKENERLKAKIEELERELHYKTH